MWDVLGRDGGGGERGDGLMMSRLVVETRIGGRRWKRIYQKNREVLSFGALLLLSVHDYTGVGTRSVLNRLSPVQGKYRPINCEYI